MTDAFAAVVNTVNQDGTCLVTPQIIEHDGTTHPQIKVGFVQGITPAANDVVLVLTARNNLDNSPIQRYFSASEACGRIVGVLTAGSVFNLTGSYKFTGSLEITQDLTVDGNLHVKGTLTVDGDTTLKGKLNGQKDVTFDQKLNVTGDSTLTGTGTAIAGRTFLSHTHGGVTPGGGTSGPVT